MKIFNCDTEWPLCLYDFTYKNKIPQYLCFRTSSDPPYIIEEYFYPEGIPVPHPVKPQIKKKGEGLLMERGVHHCRHHPTFVDNFKVLFYKADD
jgi:hypothetical protein